MTKAPQSQNESPLKQRYPHSNPSVSLDEEIPHSSPFLSIIRSWEGSYHVVQGVVPSWGDQEWDACLAVVQMDQSEGVANLHLVEGLVLG